MAAGIDSKLTAKPAVTFFDSNRFKEWAPFLRVLPSRLVGRFGLKEPYARPFGPRFTLGQTYIPSNPPYVIATNYDSAHGVVVIIRNGWDLVMICQGQLLPNITISHA